MLLKGFFFCGVFNGEFDVMFNDFNVNYTLTVNYRVDRGHTVQDLSIE